MAACARTELGLPTSNTLEERLFMRNEYILDRKNQEIEFLKNELEIIRAEREKHNAQVIVAEVVLFLFGILLGAMLMKTMGAPLL